MRALNAVSRMISTCESASLCSDMSRQQSSALAKITANNRSFVVEYGAVDVLVHPAIHASIAILFDQREAFAGQRSVEVDACFCPIVVAADQLQHVHADADAYAP